MEMESSRQWAAYASPFGFIPYPHFQVMRNFGLEITSDSKVGLMRVPARILPKPHMTGSQYDLQPAPDGFVGGSSIHG